MYKNYLKKYHIITLLDMTELVETPNANQELVYSIDTFLKFREANKHHPPNFEKYFVEQVNNFKFKRQEALDRSDIRTKLNYILTKRNISNDDEILYKSLMKTLNRVNNNMLLSLKNIKNSDNNNQSQDSEKDIEKNKENSLEMTIFALTNFKYTKIEHFQKLAELMVDKALNEPTFCSVYALLCYELSCYYIEMNNKKIYFRHILLNICQTTFETFLNNCENIERTRLIGLTKFLGELYNRGLLPSVIIRGCFDRLGNIIEKVKHVADGIAELVIVTYPTLIKEQNSTVALHIKEKLNIAINNNKLHLQSKFALQNALEKIAEY